MMPKLYFHPFSSYCQKALVATCAWLEQRMATRAWAAGNDFTLADCSAAPFLFYADWPRRIDAAHPHLIACRQRLLARPSFVRAAGEARPCRGCFPLGAPDRN